MPTAAKARILRSTRTSPNVAPACDLLTALGSTTNQATVAAFPVAGSSGFRWNPLTSATSGAPPAAPATATGNGWRDAVAENVAEQVTYAAGTWTFRARVNKTVMAVNASVTVRVTAIVYHVTSAGVHVAEIGRMVLPDTALPTVNSVVFFSASFTGSETTFDPDDKIQVEVYVQNIVLGAPAAATSAYTVALILDASASAAAITVIPQYTVQFVRSHAVTGVGTAAVARRITAFRSFATTSAGTAAMARRITAFRTAVTTATGAVARKLGVAVTKSVTATGAATMARRITGFRSFAVTAVGSPAMARRIAAARAFAVTGAGAAVYGRVLILRRAFATVASGSAAMARRLSLVRSFAVTATSTVARILRVATRKTVTTVGTPVMARDVTAARSFAVTTAGVAGYARALIFGRTFAVSAPTTTKLRLDIPEAALDRIIPAAAPDWPLNAPTKAIAGVTRDSAGAVVGSVGVRLIRESDGVRVATGISDAVTGAYSFVRGGDDPNTYRVMAVKATAPETHGVTDELMPA